MPRDFWMEQALQTHKKFLGMGKNQKPRTHYLNKVPRTLLPNSGARASRIPWGSKQSEVFSGAMFPGPPSKFMPSKSRRMEEIVDAPPSIGPKTKPLGGGGSRVAGTYV